MVKLIFGLTAAAGVLGPAIFALGIVVSGVGAGLTAIGTVIGLLLSPVALVAGAIVGAVALIYHHWDGIVQFFSDIWADIKAIFPESAAFFEGLWAKISRPVEGIFDWITAAWTDVKNWISGPADGQSLYDWLMVPVEGLFAWVTDAWDGVINLIKTPREDIWAGVTSAAATAGGAALSLFSGLSDAIAGLDWQSIGTTIGDLLVIGISSLAGLLSKITEVVGNIDWTNAGHVVGAAIAAAIVATVKTTIKIGKTIIDLLLSASEDGTLKGAAGDIGSAIYDAIIAALSGLGDFIIGLITGLFSDVNWKSFLPDWSSMVPDWLKTDNNPGVLTGGAVTH